MTNRETDCPLYRAVTEYQQKNTSYFCIPAHRRAHTALKEWTEISAKGLLDYDVTEAHGLDDLHAARGAIKEAQALAARLYGAGAARFLVNGTTCGNEVMLLSALREGDQVLLPRNAHKSFLMGLILSGAEPVWYLPRWIEGWQLWGSADPAVIRKQLKAHPGIRAVCVTSPTYQGIISDIKAIAGICHEAGVPLLVDEAHGGHLYFDPERPYGALKQGADMAVQSWHKTNGSLGQSSVLFAKGDLVDMTRVDEALPLVMSTSPSYLLMTSLDLVRGKWQRQGLTFTEKLKGLSAYARKSLSVIPGLSLLTMDRCAGALSLDESRITFSLEGISGTELSDRLFADFGIDCELADEKSVLAILTPFHEMEDVDALTSALTAIAGELQKYAVQPTGEIDTGNTFPEPVMALSPRQAHMARKTAVCWQQARGQVAGEAIIPYPPGIPLLCPGEVVTEEVWLAADGLRRQGTPVHGMADERWEQLQVIPMENKHR